MESWKEVLKSWHYQEQCRKDTKYCRRALTRIQQGCTKFRHKDGKHTFWQFQSYALLYTGFAKRIQAMHMVVPRMTESCAIPKYLVEKYGARARWGTLDKEMTIKDNIRVLVYYRVCFLYDYVHLNQMFVEFYNWVNCKVGLGWWEINETKRHWSGVFVPTQDGAIWRSNISSNQTRWTRMAWLHQLETWPQILGRKSWKTKCLAIHQDCSCWCNIDFSPDRGLALHATGRVFKTLLRAIQNYQTGRCESKLSKLSLHMLSWSKFRWYLHTSCWVRVLHPQEQGRADSAAEEGNGTGWSDGPGVDKMHQKCLFHVRKQDSKQEASLFPGRSWTGKVCAFRTTANGISPGCDF